MSFLHTVKFYYHYFFNFFLLIIIPEEYVEGFEIDEIPVTNGEFVKFIESGQYDNPNNWTFDDWQWKEKTNKVHPQSLSKKYGKWMVFSI